MQETSLDAWSWPSRLSRLHCDPSPAPTCLPSPYCEKTEEVRAGSTATSSSGRALGRHSPFHHKEGVLHGHGVPAPAASTSTAHRAPVPPGLPPPTRPVPAAARALDWGTPSSGHARRPGVRDHRGSSTRSAPLAESRTPEPAPSAASSPGSSRRVGEPDPTPRTLGCGQSRKPPEARLPYPTHVIRACPSPVGGAWACVTRPWRRSPRGGGGGRPSTALRLEGEERLVPSEVGSRLFRISCSCTCFAKSSYLSSTFNT